MEDEFASWVGPHLQSNLPRRDKTNFNIAFKYKKDRGKSSFCKMGGALEIGD